MPGSATSSGPASGSCPKCGGENPKEARFCAKCGHSFSKLSGTLRTAKPGSPAPPAAEPEQQNVLDPGKGPLGKLPLELGPYRVESVVGAGGMGWVYLARDVALSRTVAVKALSPAVAADPQARTRFEREARTIAALEHPSLTAIYFLDAGAAVPYYAMEYVEGESLEDRLEREKRLPLPDLLRWLVEAAEALSAAAAAGVIHRDIKPSNLLIRRKDQLLKITDFGLAKAATEKGITSSQVIVGTPLYMSPEQAMGRKLDFRTDVYSLGVTAYHAMAGRPPFDDESAMGVMMMHVKEPLPPLAPLAPNAPASLVKTVETMLAKEPAGRHESYEALIEELCHAEAELAEKAEHAAALRSGRSRRSATLVSHPIAVPAPAQKWLPGFTERAWAVVRHPFDFFSTRAAVPSQTDVIRHFLLVVAAASVETSLVPGAMGLGSCALILLIWSAVLIPFIWLILRIFRDGARMRDAIRILAFASTPLLAGGLVFRKFTIPYLLILTAVGIAKMPLSGAQKTR